MLKFDGKKLQKLRTERGLRQAELAKVLFGKPTASRIANYEIGVSTPPCNVLLTLMVLWDLKPHDLAR